MKSMMDNDASSPCNECSTMTARTSSWVGNPSTLPSRMARSKVLFPLPLLAQTPYLLPRTRRSVVCESSSNAPYARENSILHKRSSPESTGAAQDACRNHVSGFIHTIHETINDLLGFPESHSDGF